MSARQLVYGLRLAANMAIPAVPLRQSEAHDVEIRLKNFLPFIAAPPADGENFHGRFKDAPEIHPNLRACRWPDQEYFGFFYSDGARFAVDRHGREVWADWPENYALEDACTYLVGPVLGFVLRLRGTVCLHASAVAIEGRAVALVGFPGAGKSTTAAAFACSGFPVLSDDILALSNESGQWLVQPGYPRVNLWPDSVRRLFGSEDALPRITPTWGKRYLPLGQDSHYFASNPLPLGAIYFLDSRDSTLTTPIIEPVSSKEALMTLVANTYVNYLLDRNMRRAEFDVLGHVASQIPARRVRPAAEVSSIFNLCEAIASDAKQMMGPIPANAASVRG